MKSSGEPLIRQGESCGQLQDTLPDSDLLVNIFYVDQHLADHVGNVGHLRYSHATRGHGGCTDPYPTSLERGTCLEGDGVFVDRDARFVECSLAFLTGYVARPDVHQHQVVVRATTDKSKTVLGQAVGKGRCIGYDLGLILREGWLEGFFEAYRLGRDDMHQRATLDAGEGLGIDCLGMFRAAQDQPTPRATQGFVGGRGNKVSMADWAGMRAGGDQSGDMGYVGQQQRTHSAGNLSHSLEVDHARVGTGTCLLYTSDAADE